MMKLNEGQMKANLNNSTLRPNNPSKGWSALALGTAKVQMINWEELRCTIKVLDGEFEEPIYDGVELLFPSIGSRHFLGAIPEVGDMCVVGWFATDTKGAAGSKRPAILAWLPKAYYLGQEWIPTQSFNEDEGLLNTPKDRKHLDGVSNRIRHKMRHYEPGNIGASSSQGSDLVLDEGVLLSNRRANEIRLRDQDQALVVRSLQQFHAMSGARIYGGMVQRDARIIPYDLISDGRLWDGPTQVKEDGSPISEDELPFDSLRGTYQPHPLFRKTTLDGKSAFEQDVNTTLTQAIDPYRLMYKANLIDENLKSTSEIDFNSYGGKAILRYDVDGQKTFNQAATEYRIELNHTTDGLLPVTEQTDGMDIDRIPENRGASDKSPYIEWVLGTVVGNDAFTEGGKNLYGKPLYANDLGIIDDATGLDIENHLATLFRIKPIIGDDSPSYVGFTKGGAFRGYIGAREDTGARLKIEGGLGLEVLGNTNILYGTTGFNLNGDGALDIRSNRNSIYMYAGGTFKGDADGSSIVLEGKGNISLKSGSIINLDAPTVRLKNAASLSFSSQSDFAINSGESVSIKTNTMKQTVMGGQSSAFSSINPIVPPRDTKIIGGPGIVDQTTYTAGVKLTTALTNLTDTTTIPTGAITQTVAVGAISHIASGNSSVISPAGVSLTATAGVLSLTALAGVATITGNAGVTITSVGPVAIRGTTVTLSSPGASVGPIMCGSDINPVTGTPFVVTMIPRGQNLTP
jgi:hypothetical protein